MAGSSGAPLGVAACLATATCCACTALTSASGGGVGAAACFDTAPSSTSAGISIQSRRTWGASAGASADSLGVATEIAGRRWTGFGVAAFLAA